MIFIFLPLMFLILACFGLGEVCLIALRKYLPPLGPVVRGALAYTLGQCLLAITFMSLGLAALFTHAVVWLTLLPCSMAGIWILWSRRSGCGNLFRSAKGGWKGLPPSWKLVLLGVVTLYLMGITTLGGWVEGDAIAFYFALPKTMAFTHQLTPLPGYESFSAVGLYAEMLIAALMSLGMPGITARIFSWLNFLPALIFFYALARQAGLESRGRLITVATALTSSAAILLWGGAKTDLFAVIPAVGSCLLALLTWEYPTKVLRILTGVFCGYACVLKLSYLLPLVPGVALLMIWPQLFATLSALRQQQWKTVGSLLLRQTSVGIFFLVGFTLSAGPHFLKNYLLLDVLLGMNPDVSWYSPATARRLLLSYPLALTYGNYWAQMGNLSPLVLAFIPMTLCLKRPAVWGRNALAALSIATFLSLTLWMGVMPSVFMPRYFLATLLMLAVPAAAGAEAFCSLSAKRSLLLALITLSMLFIGPKQAQRISRTFQPMKMVDVLTDPEKEELTSAPLYGYCLASQSINAVAPLNARVLLLTYYRFWLRPDLLANITTSGELQQVSATPPNVWQIIRDNGFTYILMDIGIFPWGEKIINDKPSNIGLKLLYKAGNQKAYQIIYSRIQ